MVTAGVFREVRESADHRELRQIHQQTKRLSHTSHFFVVPSFVCLMAASPLFVVFTRGGMGSEGPQVSVRPNTG